MKNKNSMYLPNMRNFVICAPCTPFLEIDKN